MRNVNALKYCLPCSGKTGKLVTRVCASAEAERERREAARKAEEQKKKERIAARRAEYAQTERGQLEAKCQEYLRLATFDGLLLGPYGKLIMYDVRLKQAKKRTYLQRKEENNADGSPKSVTYTEVTETYPRPKYTTGRAYGRHRFVITAGTDKADAWTTIIHEIAHLATPKDKGHGDQWRSVFYDAIFEVTGERPLPGTTKRQVHDNAAACMARYLARVDADQGTPVALGNEMVTVEAS